MRSRGHSRAFRAPVVPGRISKGKSTEEEIADLPVVAGTPETPHDGAHLVRRALHADRAVRKNRVGPFAARPASAVRDGPRRPLPRAVA